MTKPVVIRDVLWAQQVAADLAAAEAEVAPQIAPQGFTEAFLLERTRADLASGVLKAERWPLPRKRNK
jgi:hypothetical protein